MLPAASVHVNAGAMEPDFWHSRWQQGQVGFHLPQPNPNLVRHYPHLQDCRRVLVPLCGKSVDMAWLASRGHGVVGVELSPIAAQAFFSENQLTATQEPRGSLVSHRGGGVEILCGDLFHVGPMDTGSVDGFLDRAALVALPEAMRAPYTRHVASLLSEGARGLLVAFEFEPAIAAGPPFGVAEPAVRALYEPFFEVTLLERRDVTEEESRFRERGANTVHESVYAMVRRARGA